MRVWEGVDKWARTGVYCSMGERVLHERLAEVNDSPPSSLKPEKGTALSCVSGWCN